MTSGREARKGGRGSNPAPSGPALIIRHPGPGRGHGEGAVAAGRGGHQRHRLVVQRGAHGASLNAGGGRGETRPPLPPEFRVSPLIRFWGVRWEEGVRGEVIDQPKKVKITDFNKSLLSWGGRHSYVQKFGEGMISGKGGGTLGKAPGGGRGGPAPEGLPGGGAGLGPGRREWREGRGMGSPSRLASRGTVGETGAATAGRRRGGLPGLAGYSKYGTRKKSGSPTGPWGRPPLRGSFAGGGLVRAAPWV